MMHMHVFIVSALIKPIASIDQMLIIIAFCFCWGKKDVFNDLLAMFRVLVPYLM